MAAKTTLRNLLERGEFVWAPCVYDCLTAHCAELVGYNAVLVSGIELELAMNGLPAGLFNWEEYIFAAERICNATSLPVIFDGENGGGTPMQVYRNCRRLALAGVQGITIEDTASGGFAQGYGYASGYGYLPAERWAANIRAAVDAVQGTDCMIVARTDCKGGGAQNNVVLADTGFLGLEEALRRAEMGYQAGAEICMVQNISYAGCAAECQQVSQRLRAPGRYLFFPDIHCTDGVPDATLDQLKAWGFALASNHAAMKGATRGVLELLSANFRNGNTCCSDTAPIDPTGNYVTGPEFHPFTFEESIDSDKKYRAYEAALGGNSQYNKHN